MDCDIKTEVNEIKAEPCDVLSEESFSPYCQNSTSEEEDASSDGRHHCSVLNGEMILLNIYENQLKEVTGKNEPNMNKIDNLTCASSNGPNIDPKDRQLVIPNVTNSGITADLLKNCAKLHVEPNYSLVSKNIHVTILPKDKKDTMVSESYNNNMSNIETGTLQGRILNDKQTSICALRERAKKRKLHEMSDPLSDEEYEKRRLNAINAKKNREIKKLKFDQVSKELHTEKTLNANLRVQIKSLSDEKRIAVLEKENAELKYQILLDKYTKLLKMHSACTKPT